MSDVMTLKLGEIGPIQMCKRILKSQTNPHEGVPFYKIKTFGKKADVYIDNNLYKKYREKFNYPKKGDVLISAAGTLGRTVQYNGEKAYFQDSNIVWIANDEKYVLNDYLYYFYQTHPWKATIGSTIPRLYNHDIANLQITFPKDKHIQKCTVNVLKHIDQKINNNNLISKQLETMAKTIYDYWFLQFEFPDKNGKPYKSNGGKMIWNNQLKQEIPEGWEVKPLKSLINNVKSGAWGKEKEEKDYIQKVNCIRGADFPGLMSSNDLNIPVRYIRTKDGKKLLSNGDLIVEISGGSPTQSTGRISYINSVTLKRFKNPITTSNFCKAISLENKEFQYWFYLTWDNFYRHGIFFNYEGKTTGIKNLMFKSFISTNIIIPDNETMHEFYNKASKMFDEIQYKALENQQLKSLRDFLLPMLMNGQVSISD